MRSLVIALLLIASTASAQDWRANLRMIDNDLRAQHYAHARKWSIKMINSMCDHLGTGPDAMYTLATTVAYRAMAEAGLQKPEEADWYSHVAFALYPKLAERDWSAYGEVGEWLTARKHEAELQVANSDTPPPVPIRRSEPKCPLSAIAGGYYQSVTVGAIVDSEGSVRSPRLVSQTVAPTLIYAAFESLKDFQFEPGTPAKYAVTVHFKPPHP